MRRRLGSRCAAALLCGLLAAGSSASAVRADEGPHDPVVAPAPTTESGHEHEQEQPALERKMAGGNARRYSDGQKVTYRVTVDQKLQPRGRYPVEPVTGRLDATLTETVTVDADGPLVTVEVTEAEAEGFQAEAERRAALDRRVQFRPGARTALMALKQGPDGKPNLGDQETVAPLGTVGEVRMVDALIRAHLFNPVIPADDYRDGQSFDDTAFLPVGWILGIQRYLGSITVSGDGEVDGRDVVRMKAVHVSPDATVRVRAMDNAVDALQGKARPEPNDFFASTIFPALFPPGSTYESLMPPLPLKPIERGPARRRPPLGRPRRPRRRAGIVGACLLAVVLASCTDPRMNPNVVSLNLTGPLEIHHESVLDKATGIVISSEVTATAKMEGKVHLIPEEIKPQLPAQVNDISEAPVALDGEWTVTEQLAGPLPESTVPARFGGAGTIGLLAAAVALLAGFLLIRSRRRRAEEAPPQADPEPEPEPAGVD